ncbi:MAG: biotin--[acetyl-CoA-carboxylase] ligase [Sterolibacterium sp.]
MNSSQPTSPARFDVAVIAAALGELSPRFDVRILAECDSSNARLMALAEAGAPAGSVIVAEHQLAGRGRRGNNWFSSADASLTFSLLWRFPPQVQLTGLSLAVGVALAYALERLGIAGIALKWPNDVLLRGGKLAGVLIELVPGIRPSAAVIGVGINLHLPQELPPEIKQNAAALADAGITLPAPDILLARLLAELHGVLQSFATEGFPALREAWQERHAYTGQVVRLLADHAAPLEGRCLGVDGDGALLLETSSGTQPQRIISGEVSLRKS